MRDATVTLALLAVCLVTAPSACTAVAQHGVDTTAESPEPQQTSKSFEKSRPQLKRDPALGSALRTAEDAPANRILVRETHSEVGARSHHRVQHALEAANAAPSALAASASTAAARGLRQAAGGADAALTPAQAHELLNATSSAVPQLMQPLPAEGEAAVERHSACGAFYQQPIDTVALVGNGPLTEEQRLDIQDADLIIRFNKLNNRFCGERLDVWLLRRAEQAALQWHGLGEAAHCSTPEILSHGPVLWLYGGSSWWFNPYSVVAAAVKFPRIVRRLTWQGLPFAPWKNLYQAYVAPVGSPSTGWIGLMLALDCKPTEAELHLYGFNWSDRHWRSHAVAAEERFIRNLAARGRLTVHETACKGLRFCGACNVVADGETVSDDMVAEAGGDVTKVTVPCSAAQATSKGELSAEELLFREPEVDAPPSDAA